MRKRRNMLIALELVLAVLCVFLMYILQSRLFYVNANREIDLTYDDIGRILEQVMESSDDIYDSYEMIHIAKAKMAKFYIRNDEVTIYSPASMKRLKELLDVYNVYIVDSEGNVTYSAIPSNISNFGEIDLGNDSYFGMMKDSIGKSSSSLVAYYMFDIEEEEDEQALHSLSAVYLSDGDYVVIDDNTDGLVKRQETTGSFEVALPRITLAKNGFVFAINEFGYISSFFDKTGKPVFDISELGISMDMLKDGFRGTLNLQGERYYCGIQHYDNYGVYVICAIPSDEITSNFLMVSALPLFVAFIFLSLQLLYSLMLIGEPREKDREGKEESLRRFLFRRMAVLLVLAILFTVGSSLYPQMMYAMYLQADSNKSEADALAGLLSENEEIQKHTREKYYKDLENLTSLAAKFISDNPSQIRRKDLETMAKNLGAEHILLYNRYGTVILSDAYYSGLKLSSDPEDLSYEFRKVLTGEPVLAQSKVDEKYLEEPYRYAGAIVTDENDEINGFVQLLFSPDFLGTSLSGSVIEKIPATFSGRNNAYAFIVDSRTNTFAYYPNEDYIDVPVEDYGITDEIMRDGYFSLAWFDGGKKLFYCAYWDDYTILTVASIGGLTVDSIRRGIYISLVGIMIQLLFFFGILLTNGSSPVMTENKADNQWTEEDQRKLAEQLAAGRITRLLRISFFVFSGAVSIIYLMREVLFANNEVIRLLLNECWNNGIHIFSVTAIFFVVCIVYFVVSLILLILELIGRLMNSRGETIVRMLISFIRYLAVIGLVFYCANLLGAPTGTLLASAGILTIVIGLGAQSLVTDVLAGLFIIFEKVYKVGDIIMIGTESWRGRVLEIGIRNTRVMDMDANTIRVLHNSSLNQIINMSELPTCVYTTIGTEYGEKLAVIEDILAKELPDMHERVEGAVEGPVYSGVSELGDSAVILKFRTKCRNEDYYKVKYGVNRELKLLFDKYDINVPFPQVVINEREAKADRKEQQ